ncbi:MAG TPA: DUF4918 family protein [Bacteroidales bacterium]|nr:DUF4918 family protein [Bacteroidales bacterium]HOK74168.1 DUF4918 family protein [Bacteroidales bacterium]HOM39485.1 DUF4918 family protein [Bacteroidales bacterium]HOU31153.1 DUF4918 family protein [Bacteroidales bacterium]HPP91867.1 DUF4918 family protein [Bacteroidales bacterium]
MASSLADRIIAFYRNLDIRETLPPGISIMNPYRKDSRVMKVVEEFYRKFYSDNNPRNIILGINPGRFGAGITGITFTDTIRLWEKCGIIMEGTESRELSSEFVYEMIDRFGGVNRFFSHFYLSAVSPLGFTLTAKEGKEINFNYYDNPDLLRAVYDFIVENIERQLDFGIKNDVCFCLGTGKNYRFLKEINEKYGFFNKIIPLEHPRFIMQYRRKVKDFYITRYIGAFSETINKKRFPF